MVPVRCQMGSSRSGSGSMPDGQLPLHQSLIRAGLHHLNGVPYRLLQPSGEFGDVVWEGTFSAAIHFQHMPMPQEYCPIPDLLILAGSKVEPRCLLRELGMPPGFKLLNVLHLAVLPQLLKAAEVFDGTSLRTEP